MTRAADAEGRATRAARRRDSGARARGNAAAQPGALDRFAAGRGAIWLVVAVSLIANVYAFDPRLNTNGDNAQFLVLAESILSGRGLSHINSPRMEANTKYPFLYPVMLAGVLAVFPRGLVPAKIFSVVLSIASSALLLVLLRRRGRPGVALAAALAAAVSPHVLEFSHITLAEIPSLFTVLVALLALEKAIETCPAGRKWPLLALLAVAAAYYVKTVSVALAVAAALAAAVRRRFALAGFFIVGFALLWYPWNLRNKATGEEITYVWQFLSKNPYDEQSPNITPGDFVARVATNAARYEGLFIPNALFPLAFRGAAPAPASERILFLVPLALVGVGLVAAIRRGDLVVGASVLAFLGLLHIWPEVWSSTRFLVPILPLFIAYAVIGAGEIAARLAGPGAGTRTAMVAAGVLFAVNAAATVRDVSERQGYTPDWVNFFAAADWIRDNTPPDAIVSSRSAYVLYWKIHRRTVGYAFTTEGERVFRELVDSGARYVLVDAFYWTGTTGRYLVPALEAHRDRWKVVWASPSEPRTYVLEILPEGSASP